MIGCGKYPEKELLLYVDGRHGNVPDVENHLKSCPDCLRDIVALNCLDARSAVYQGGPVRRPGFVSVIRDKGSRLIREAFTNSGQFRAVAEVATRGARGASGQNEKTGAEFRLEHPAVTIRVWSDQNGAAFLVRVTGAALAGKAVELRRTGEQIPVLTLAAQQSGDVQMPGLAAGDYDIRFAAESVRISLRDADDHTGFMT